ncbi:hypothetical protein K1719_023368 [Acacia pycnantha]|nr:hypothetical protein K1719_023368 [Acacia pycnantha]
MTSDMQAKHGLYKYVLGREWKEVVEIMKKHPDVQSTKITKSEDNVLHLAITLDAPEAYVIELIDVIEKNNPEVSMEIIKAKNKQDNTPLHCAASRGSKAICERIIAVDERLVLEGNKEGETPLFLAALNGRTRTFKYLHSVCCNMATTTKFSELWKRKNGDTILHCTLEREYFELAYHIIYLYGDDDEKMMIVSYENREGVTPLQVLASVPSAFKSGTRLTWCQKLLYSLSACLLSEELKDDDKTQNEDVEAGNSDSSKINDEDTPEQFHETTRLGSIKKIKEKHTLVWRIMEKLLELNSEYKYKENHQIAALSGSVSGPTEQGKSSPRPPKKDNKSTALLEATKYGLLDLVERILEKLPVAIYDKTEPRKRNVVHTAIQKRQTHVLMLLMEHPLWHSLVEEVDADGNNVLHMAAFLPKHMPWDVYGSALQMQYEAKWFQYVKERVPPYLYANENKAGDTPEEVYVAEHKKLLKESNEWIRDASSSYSIVATLTAGVTYATSYTVPGGTNDDTGRPPLEGQFALNVFLIAIFISFCFSITSLGGFLAIYSSRKQPDDFRRNLPLKLCFACTSFYVAIVSMMVSFCAAHSLEVDPRMKAKVYPMYSLIVMPLLFYAVAQIPLYWDLMKASFKKAPQPRYVGESITVEGDRRLVPATDDELIEVDDFLEFDQIEMGFDVDTGLHEGCSSIERSSSKKLQLECL